MWKEDFTPGTVLSVKKSPWDKVDDEDMEYRDSYIAIFFLFFNFFFGFFHLY